MGKCDFCDEFSGGRQNAYAQRYGQSAQRTIFATARFHVLPSLGQIVEGHLLLVPTEHFCALADLTREQIAELDEIRRDIRLALESTYGKCVFFEHGIRGEGSGGCGIDHAHMHAVPVAADGVLYVLRQEFGGVRTRSFREVGKSVREGASYLFFEDISGKGYVFPASVLPSQYMRKLVAASIGKANWDWRARGKEPELISTIERLSPRFSPARCGV